MMMAVFTPIITFTATELPELESYIHFNSNGTMTLSTPFAGSESMEAVTVTVGDARDDRPLQWPPAYRGIAPFFAPED